MSEHMDGTGLRGRGRYPRHTRCSCYVQVERSARLEQGGYDQVTLPIVNGASASGTL